MLKLSYVKSRLKYEKSTGKLFWKTRKVSHRYLKTWNTKFVGKEAGSCDKYGYIIVTLDRKPYKAHMLVWLLKTGKWPTKDIDHEDTVKHNNIWNNLRLASDAQNGANTGKYKTNSSGYKGVSSKNGQWQAKTSFHGKQIYLGLFPTKIKAHKAYKLAIAKYHKEFANDGE